ncbi:uncharacterized protein LOC135342280 [Halichondria panicea]|uniref:uncharacterized protein LOC135342280 n=1 Tax=Halichondria panicea TaxID=6063 RepID=UPI00312B2FE9
MGCMESKEDQVGSDSPTNQPLMGTADGGMSGYGYEGGVVNVSMNNSDQNEARNGMHLSEQRVGGQYLQSFSGQPQDFPVTGQPIVSSGSFRNTTNGLPTELDVQGDGVRSPRGIDVMENLRKAYEWHSKFDSPSQEFLSLMDRLYMECQVHLSSLSSKGDAESRIEADVIVQEMIAVRNRWGTKLLPNSICNAFVRERIPHTVDGRDFRIDCAQFFEPVPFYGSQQTDNPGELMKLYRFSVYDLSRNEVLLRYYLERSNVTQLYHVLCFTCDNYRGQVYAYGSEVPSYWEVRNHMVQDVKQRLKSQRVPNLTNTTIPTQQRGPVIIQIP